MPSTLMEIEQERQLDIWRPTKAHYERWLHVRGSSENADELMSRGFSIHVHFYDTKAISELLALCVKKYGFSGYTLIYTPNHKDFHFCLWK